jgi:hypothetical protein
MIILNLPQAALCQNLNLMDFLSFFVVIFGWLSSGHHDGE